MTELDELRYRLNQLILQARELSKEITEKFPNIDVLSEAELALFEQPEPLEYDETLYNEQVLH